MNNSKFEFYNNSPLILKNNNEDLNLDVIFDEAQVTVLKTLEDKHYCTVTFKDVNINTTTETFVHDAATKNTEVLQVKHDYTVYESYTYGLNRSKNRYKRF